MMLFSGLHDPAHPLYKREGNGALTFRCQGIEPVKSLSGIAFAGRITPLGEHIIVPPGQAVGDACLVEEFHLPGIGHHMILARTALELGGKQWLVALHRTGNVIYDPVIMHVPVRQEFRNMINSENNLALATEKILVHGDIDRKFITVSVNPAGKIMIQGNSYTSLAGHA